MRTTWQRQLMKTYKEAIRNNDFAISAEIFLRAESAADMIREQTQLLQPYVDGIMLTDNQSGQLHLSPVVAASFVMANGVDPIVQLSTRNRNRIALLGELLGAAAIGVSSLVLVKGNRVPDGFDPRPRAVFDLDAAELITMATRLKGDEQLPAIPDLFIGSVVTPHAPKPGWVPEKLTRKADAGVQFVQTHICMDPDLLRDYLRHLVAAGMPRRVSIVVTLVIPASADDARWLRDNHPNDRIPDDVIRRLEQAKDAELEGVLICAEQLQQLADIPGISGAHLVATRNLATITAAIVAAGMGPGA